MDKMIEMMLAIALFSAMHERVVELVRESLLKVAEKADKAASPAIGSWARWVADGIVKTGASTLVGVTLALGTGANALAFVGPTGSAASFVATYGSPVEALRGDDPLRHVMGCLLMGCTVTLGSSFWHDTAKGLVDVRARIRGLPEELTTAVTELRGDR